MKDCLTCKKHYSQSGKCFEEKKNCLFYEKEPRGRKARVSFTLNMQSDAATPIITYNSKIIIDDNGEETEMTVIKINWINLEKMTCNIDAEYYENERPHFEKIRRFKIVR